MRSTNLWQRLMDPLRQRADVEPRLEPLNERAAIADVLASCEYELRQVSRDVARLHPKAPAVPTGVTPFVIDGRQRQRPAQ